MRRKRHVVMVVGMVSMAILVGVPLWIVDRAFLHEKATHELAVAVYKNDTQDALAALRAGADANTRATPKEMPPTLAQFVRQFWRQMRGQKVSLKSGPDHRPPMIAVAATKNNARVVQALLDAGAKPDEHARYAEDEGYDESDATEGKTALMWAAKHNNLVMTKELLAKGANPDFDADGRGEAPLLLTADPAVMEALLAHGADIHIEAKHSKFYGITPLRDVILHLVIEGGLPEQERQQCYQCVETLLAHGADINEHNRDPDSGYNANAIQMVAQHGEPADVRFILSKGADPYLRDVWGMDALGCAIEDGMTDNMKTLLAHGIDPNRRDIDGTTPLFQAVEHGEDGPIQALIEAGAKVNVRDKKGRTPLQLAEDDGNDSVEAILRAAGAQP